MTNMIRGRLVTIVAASSASFLLGTTFTEWRKGIPLRTSDSATTLIAQPPAVLPPELPTSSPRKGIEDMEVWKKPSRASEIMKFGWPGYDNLRTYEDFVLSYDRKTRTAHWVMEHLSPDRLTYDPSVDRGKCEFRPDTSIHQYFRSLNDDYRRSGYDRGHLAAAGNHRRTQQSVDQTFFLTNMSPQVGKGFNRDKWNDLEKHVRKLARKNPNVYICTGPLYLPKQEADGSFYVKYKVIGPTRVAVPTHFFKVALIEKERNHYELEAYLMPNEAIPDAKPISDFLVPLDAIERAAGFLIFENVPKTQLKKINGKSTGGLLW